MSVDPITAGILGIVFFVFLVLGYVILDRTF